MSKRVLGGVAFGLILAVAPSVSALPIAATDLDSIIGSVGVVEIGPLTDTFTVAFPPPNSMGTLENVVYFNETTGIYTYTHKVTPSLNNISELNTAFPILGFNFVAGWSFSEAAAAGGLGTAADVSVQLDFDGTLDYEIVVSIIFDPFLDSGESVTFFFQSTLPPGFGDYNLINSEAGSATSFAPVPEPGTLFLAGAGLIALGALRRRKSKSA